MSQASFVSDVEMAHDEVFAGPMSESVPSSTTGFSHRRNRADSTASFTYYPEEEQKTSEFVEDEAVSDTEEGSDGAASPYDEESLMESGLASPHGHRMSSTFSGLSVEDPLLNRRDSMKSDVSGYGGRGRMVQKIYIVTEDLTIVVAGFSTSYVGQSIYLLLCFLSCGLLYLVFRWLPHWKTSLTGRATPLKECSWVVIENQWNEMSIQQIAAVQFGHSFSTLFGKSSKMSHMETDEEDDPTLDVIRFLDYRYIRFVFNPLKDAFVLNGTKKDANWKRVLNLREGLEAEEQQQKERIFGLNLIDIEEKSIPQLLVDEAFHPFYIFQIASLILWSVDEYYYYAVAIFIISIISITTTLIETRTTMKRLREISRFDCKVRVLRKGFWRSVASRDLVPGDAYEVSDPSLMQFPCDSLLLAGDCIVNESMLTGESIPVSKIPATDETLQKLDLSATSVHPDIAKHFLFSGTKIVRARRPQDDQDEEAVALAVVVRTGFNTTKGALVRSMLFPKPSGFKFYRDSFRYISVMGMVAGVGFLASFVNFVRLHLAWHLIIVRALDLVTIVVPPALPATLTIGTNFALSRLKKKSIFCISPQRVNVGGKLDMVCFDKTGTLTEEGLDILGVRVVERPAMRFSEILTDADAILPISSYERDPTIDYNKHKAMLYTMATCHSLRIVDDQFVGDPLELKMFSFTGWSYDEGGSKAEQGDEIAGTRLTPAVARPPPGMEYDLDERAENPKSVPTELGILKSFEFISQLRRASVVVRQYGAQDGHIYVKGAPEVMKDICRPESFPVDYDELLGFYTHRGYRVIACATKTVSRLNWAKTQRMARADAESNLDFVGFIVFENKLKDTTTEVIDELNEAGIRNVMCTGDNILTAISVARECHMIEKSAHCFVPHFMVGDALDPKARLVWESADNAIYTLDENTLLPLPPPAEGDVSLPPDAINMKNYCVAVSGDVFRWIIDFGREETLKQMLACGQVFARMSPDEKHELVEKFQSIDYTCGFCGDGANDCGALKVADVGISLSEAEASVAAPFTSRVFDISCVPEVIREGRAALVTSFCCFKYMSLYSAIQFTTVSFLYASASNLGDFQFLFIDLLLILPIAIFMGWTGPNNVLCRKKPTASLVSSKVLTPLLGQIVICIFIQAIGFKLVQQQPWYIPPVLNREKSNVQNSQNTTLFLLSCFQYILSAVVLSRGPPFRQPMTQNLPFVTTILIALLFSSYMLFDPSQGFADFMQLTDMSAKFKIFILVLGLGGFACAMTAEIALFPRLSKLLKKTHDRLFPSRRKKRKEYKILAEKMRM
ncbi:hypothetical protein MMC25_003853 [Agyrium rufum]|nr:hypothetical protein [Agyrium rufum]